jgi:hypothetical protein
MSDANTRGKGQFSLVWGFLSENDSKKRGLAMTISANEADAVGLSYHETGFLKEQLTAVTF